MARSKTAWMLIHRRQRVSSACAAIALLALSCVAPASAGLLEPRGNKVFFGVSDTGDPAQFGEFSEAVKKHPAIIESFRTWVCDFPESIQRWQTARDRPLNQNTSADSGDGHELVSPQAIAEGAGDEY